VQVQGGRHTTTVSLIWMFVWSIVDFALVPNLGEGLPADGGVWMCPSVVSSGVSPTIERCHGLGKGLGLLTMTSLPGTSPPLADVACVRGHLKSDRTARGGGTRVSGEVPIPRDIPLVDGHRIWAYEDFGPEALLV